MGALVTGLLELFQWLAATFKAFAAWLTTTIQAIATWVLSLVQSVLTAAWNLLVDLVTWAASAVFALLGIIVDLLLAVLTILVGLLPQVPPDFAHSISVVVPAFNVANQILPISDAITAFSLWMAFYGVMSLWRVITFIRGGR